MGAYKREAGVVIQLGAYIHRVLTFYGCLLSRFYGMFFHFFKCFLILVSVVFCGEEKGMNGV